MLKVLLSLSILLTILNALSLYYAKKAFEENHKKQDELYAEIENLKKENKELREKK